MFARVTYVQAPEGKVEDGLRIWYENILPVTMARDGFQGVLSLVNRETGKAVSLTLWDIEDELIASTEADYHRQAVEKYGDFFKLAHAPENYEVHWYAGPLFAEETEAAFSTSD